MSNQKSASARFRPNVESLEAREVPSVVTTGPSSSASPYVLPTNGAVDVTSILSVGDTIGGYTMAGIPDGLGAFDNGDGTFTLLMNHELGNTVGAVHTHGAKGAFVSEWVIDKTTLQVISGHDLIQTVYGWDVANQTTGAAATVAFNRFCSADLPAVSAFYNAATGLGTTERLFLNGEEGGATGYQLATVVTGADAGKSYILGKFNLSTNGSGLTGVGAWENALANPYAQDKTVVIGNNDGGTGIMSNALAVYVGTKQSTGTEADKAGLTNGTLKFVNITGNPVEIVNGTTRATNITNGTRFTLSGTSSTTFSRPEDGAWNPLNSSEYYFVTTDRLDTVSDGLGTQVGRTRLWRLTFDDITDPGAGGKIDLLIDGRTVGGQKVNMFDNITVSATTGQIVLQEDVGGAAHNGKLWLYDPQTDGLSQIAKHDPSRFGDVSGGVVTPATGPFNNDEETSGVIDMSAILGTGTYLFVDQAHYPTGNATTVEGGQLMFMRIGEPKVESVVINDGGAQRSKINSVTVTFNTQVTVGTGAFELKTTDGTAVAFNTSTSVVGGKTVVVFTFSGSGVVGGSLADGSYTLTVHGDKITDSLGQRVDADGDNKLGGDLATSFKRLFGDLNGDGDVTGAEVSASAHSNGAKVGDADYFWFLDYDGNGKIDGKDHREVARRNGQG